MGPSESTDSLSHIHTNAACNTLAHICANRNTDVHTNACARTVFLSSRRQ